MPTRVRSAVITSLAGVSAIVIGIVAGCGTPGPAATSTISPSPSAAASPSPSATAAPTASGPTSLMDSPEAGDLPAGAYYLDLPAYPARIDFEVPAGWWHFWPGATRQDSDAHAILVNSLDTGAANGSAWGLAFTVVGDVWVDPCDPAAGSVGAAATRSADALADAFSSSEAFPVTSVEDVTVGGYAGKRVEITRPETTTCEGTLFDTPSGYDFGPIFSSTEPIVNQFTLLDVEGSVLVIWTTDFPGTTSFEVDGGASPDPQAHVEDQVQLRDILDSIVITPH
jgi:hypothetical protein